jgi:formylglycine-generating enzyme required for sulfatase activity
VKADGYRNRAWRNAAVADGRWDEHGFKAQYPDETIVTPRDCDEPFNLSNHPVVYVSWYEAMAYASWLTAQLRNASDTPPQLAQVLAAGGCVRLPTDAEWVRAARGDKKSEYPWGDKADPNRANYDETEIESTSAVGCFPGGASQAHSGIEELSGNVWEWCMDEYETGAGRVVRGGGWVSYAGDCRSAYRSRSGPSSRSGNLGFRLVLAPSSTNSLEPGKSARRAERGGA